MLRTLSVRVGLALGAVAAACSPKAGGSSAPGNNGGSVSMYTPGGSGSTLAGVGGYGGSSQSESGGSINFDTSSGGGPLGDTPDGACASTSSVGEKVTTTEQIQEMVAAPVALYIMQDQSLSMAGQKWMEVQTAIQAFVNDPASNGIDVAIKFFAAAGSNPIAPDCTGMDYTTPDAAIGPLPQNAQAIVASVNAHGPATFTPIEPALRGGIDFCQQFEASSATGEKCALVFITDGQPDQCDGNQADLAQIAADGLTAGVLTFTVGMTGADFNMLDAIAQSGGTDCTPMTQGAMDQACDVTSGSQAFIDALNLIRGTITKYTTKTVVKTTQLNCQYNIPNGANGQPLDIDKVNVQLTVNGAVHSYGQVPSASACSQYGNEGWYYDNPATPTQIDVCPGTCADIRASTGDGGTTTVEAAPDARVDILLGCQTVIAVPQ